MAVSIRSKLLGAFAVIIALMIGLAISGLIALQQANTRTVELVRDQARIAVFQEIESQINFITMLAFASASIEPHGGKAASGTWRESPAFVLVDAIDELRLHVGRAKRNFGGPASPDNSLLDYFSGELEKLNSLSRHIKALRHAGDLDAVQSIAVDDLPTAAQKLRGNTYAIIKEIEREMAEKAATTDQAYNTARQRVIAAAAIAVALALLLGYVLSSSLVWPLREVGATLHKVASGGFETTVTVPNRDEIGDLARDVNTMGKKLGELYDKVDSQRRELADWNAALEDKVAAQIGQIERTNRLRRFLPAKVADMIVNASDDADLLGSRRGDIAVLFADLRGFTAYARVMPPEQVIGALNAFHAASGPLIEERGGTLERFLGDGLMVLFNAPAPIDAPLEKALDLARDMQAAFPAVMAPYQTGDARLGLGIGIATGMATLGQIGFEGRLDYSAIGAAPNLAARLCDQAGDGQVLICEASARQTSVTLDPVGPFDLKGFDTQIGAFAVQ